MAVRWKYKLLVFLSVWVQGAQASKAKRWGICSAVIVGAMGYGYMSFPLAEPSEHTDPIAVETSDEAPVPETLERRTTLQLKKGDHAPRLGLLKKSNYQMGWASWMKKFLADADADLAQASWLKEDGLDFPFEYVILVPDFTQKMITLEVQTPLGNLASNEDIAVNRLFSGAKETIQFENLEITEGLYTLTLTSKANVQYDRKNRLFVISDLDVSLNLKTVKDFSLVNDRRILNGIRAKVVDNSSPRISQATP